MTTVEILQKAKAELARRGLFKGYFSPGRGADRPVCAIGAMNAAREGNPRDCRWHHIDGKTLEVFAKAAGLERTGQIPKWNDAPERTLDEVLDAFDRAIALASAPKEGTRHG